MYDEPTKTDFSERLAISLPTNIFVIDKNIKITAQSCRPSEKKQKMPEGSVGSTFLWFPFRYIFLYSVVQFFFLYVAVTLSIGYFFLFNLSLSSYITC